MYNVSLDKRISIIATADIISRHIFNSVILCLP